MSTGKIHQEKSAYSLRNIGFFGIVLALILFAGVAVAASTPQEAIDQHMNNRDLKNPESFIMGTQYDRRLGDGADSVRTMLYEIFPLDEEKYAGDNLLDLLMPKQVPSYGEKEYLSKGDATYDQVVENLAKLYIYPEQIYRTDYQYSWDYAQKYGYLSVEAIAFSVNGEWFYYDSVPWRTVYLYITNAPMFRADETIEYQKLIGTWSVVGETNLFSEEIYIYTGVSTDDTAYMVFNEDYTITDSYQQQLIGTWQGGGRIGVGDGNSVMGLKFEDEDHLYIFPEIENDIDFITTTVRRVFYLSRLH